MIPPELNLSTGKETNYSVNQGLTMAAIESTAHTQTLGSKPVDDRMMTFD
jgi:hypothetical protein